MTTTITSVMLERPITWHPNFPVLRKRYQWDGNCFPKYLVAVGSIVAAAGKGATLCSESLLTSFLPSTFKNPNNMRLTKDQYALQLAEAAAARSEDPHLKVGAVALTEDGHVIAAGYNGLSHGLNPSPDFWESRTMKSLFMIHAEMNLCALFKRGEAHTVAVTHSPCAFCARVLVAAGVKRVIFRVPYDRDPDAIKVLTFHGVEVLEIGA